jgi:hypothetical protein
MEITFMTEYHRKIGSSKNIQAGGGSNMRIFLKIGLLCRNFSCKENWMATHESTGRNIICNPKKKEPRAVLVGEL